MVHKSLVELIKICSVLPALAVLPAFGASVNCGGDACDVPAGDEWQMTGIDVKFYGALSGAGDVVVNGYGKDANLDLYGSVANFTGTFKSAQGSGGPGRNWYPTITFHDWSASQTFNLGTSAGAAGAFVFDGKNTVKIAADNANQARIFLNDNKLDNASTATGGATHFFLGGTGDDKGRDVTLSGYNLEKGNIFVGGLGNFTRGDLTADVRDSNLFGLYASGSNSTVFGAVELNMDNVNVSDRIVGLYVQAGGGSKIAGTLKMTAKNVTAANMFGQQIDMTRGTEQTGVFGGIYMDIEDSTIGNLRGVNANNPSGWDTWVPNNYIASPLIDIKLKNSMVTDELVAVGPYLKAHNVNITVSGNSAIGYTRDDAGALHKTKGDGWIIAGAQRPGGRVDNTNVTLDTDGSLNKIYIAGDVNVGSRQKSGADDSDVDSVTGNATLTMRGRGEIYTGDLRAYHVGGKSTLNITDAVTATTGNIYEFDEINIGETSTLVSNETITLDRGAAMNVAGTISGNGTLTLADGATLSIGTSKIEQGTLNLDGTIFATVDTQNKLGRLYADTITGSGTLNLTNVATAGTYKIFNTDNNIKVDAGFLFNAENNGANGVVISHRSADDIASDTGLSVQAAAVTVAMANSTNRQFVMQYRQMVASLQQDDAGLFEANIPYYNEQAARANPYDKPVLHSMTSALNNQVMDVVGSRMVGGRAGGDASVGYGAWAQGMHNKTKYSDAFSGTTGGLAFGLDALINRKYTVGVGYANNTSDIDAHNRDIEVTAHTLFAYAQYKPNKWFVNAAAQYTMAEYDEDTTVFSVPVSANYDVDSYGAQVMTGYDFATGITPSMGVRYLHMAQDDYSNELLRISGADSDFATAVAGLRYAFEIQSNTTVKWQPNLYANATYDFMSDDVYSTVVMPGVANYRVRGDRLSRMGGEFGVGIGARFNNVLLSLNYELDLHKDYTSQTGMVKLKCNF